MRIIGIVTGLALPGTLFAVLGGGPASAADSPAGNHGVIVAGTRVTSGREYSVNDRDF
uniref:hypothetical protein n=1 Tax=Actinomadura sp. CA-154981 TaxID=3240037 RepID=UPI003F49ABF7